MDGIIKAHNTKILRKEDSGTEKDLKSCNCRDKSACPVANKCLKIDVVYKATVVYEDETEQYIGKTESTFKTRYMLHKSSLKHSKHRNKQSSQISYGRLKIRTLLTNCHGTLLTRHSPTGPEKNMQLMPM